MPPPGTVPENANFERNDAVTPFGSEPDTTLSDEILRLKLSDRLRMLSNYANAIARLRGV